MQMPRGRILNHCLLLAAACCSQLLAAATPPVPATGSQLDAVESRVCGANIAWQSGVVASADLRAHPARAGELARGVQGDARRAALEYELNSRLIAAQDSIRDSAKADFLRSQAQYTQLTGHEFDTRLCDGGRVRVTHAMREQQRKEDDMQAFSARMKQSLADGEAYRQAEARRSDACQAHAMLEIEPDRAARLFTAAEMDGARKEFGDFTRDWQRTHGAPFDPATSCKR